MRKALCFVPLVTLVLSCSEGISAQSAAPGTTSPTDEVRIRRVRSEDPTITALIAQASEGSATFQAFLDMIDRSDGLVYIERGRCRHGGAACMALTVKLAGPNRMLRIVIDQRRADCDLDLMASIGHELWHAIEVLREPSLRSYAHLYHFFSRDGRHTERAGSFGAWETPAAIKAGFTVLEELYATSPKEEVCKGT
jgi:hypothetical protein